MDEPEEVEEPLGHLAQTRDAGVLLRELLLKELPFFILLVLTILGVAFTTFLRQPLIVYWEFLAPLIGVVCVLTGWPHAHDRDAKFRLIWTQTLHWAAFLIAMNLVFLTGVSRLMDAQAIGLTLLLLLALGTFIAGVHAVSWQICVLGVTMALGVPAIAWIYNSALVLLFGFVVLVGIGLTFWWRLSGKRTEKSAEGDL
ncbi:hypothetical protein [Methylocapsa aurea]|uniref:hypothetical protein n=1 Tax=Methylocapsa aurea TaxID=663610 RepID=UPI001FD87F45|nr:hypothetical protein [Methylocapsa aurea]